MVSNNDENNDEKEKGKTDEEERDSKKLGIISEINNILSNEKKKFINNFQKNSQRIL